MSATRRLVGLLPVMLLGVGCSGDDEPDLTEPPPDVEGVSGHWFGVLNRWDNSSEISLELVLEQNGDTITGTVATQNIPGGIRRSFWSGDSIGLDVPNVIEGGNIYMGLPEGDTLRGVNWTYFLGQGDREHVNEWYAIRR